ncbi:uncharacterized protein LOC114758765 isoform X2 [Neltuma alba]|uniref:uncharacterized protein LOC114758765 isoform X1 n=1 Tax=Neltuma alba TaxID=207710 RepID=UPI0010A42FD2|nr:uncharacterized protein LOC114758765 isoform X1 [Prosopis alba]XP_028803685.1 uncharacterized protein LOC114758765 isoform X2 [Prosopis alba]XP_028803686.1 uncharacterized protein LOC114758765 isoform X2 [Prosopis alba]
MQADSIVDANCPDEGCVQPSVDLATEMLPCDSQISISDDVQNGTTDDVSTAKSSPKSPTSENVNDLKSGETNDNLTGESPKSTPDTKMKKIITKVPHLEFNFSVVGTPRVHNPVGKSTSMARQKQPVLPPTNSRQNGRTQSIDDKPVVRDKLTCNPGHEKSRELTHGHLLASQQRNVHPPTGCQPTRRAQSRPMSRDKLNWNAKLEKSPELPSALALADQKPVILPRDSQLTRRDLSMSDKTMSKDKLSWSNEPEMSAELIRGPRCYDRNFQSEPSSAKQTFSFTVSRDKYNLPEFRTQYENANFYVIKSFNEDDIHKSIKYNVWTSTSYGNKKLNAAFLDAEAKSSETGKKCPVFLFFSVNGSGQFVGVAEMIGPVDFNKDMRFWKGKKYYGFFPIRWHIIKDVPNTQFRYIILPNNDNQPVTYSRDTQEVGLKQGIEMLNIFKRYLAKTSLLDDYDFYANRDPKKGVSCSKQC